MPDHRTQPLRGEPRARGTHARRSRRAGRPPLDPRRRGSRGGCCRRGRPSRPGTFRGTLDPDPPLLHRLRTRLPEPFVPPGQPATRISGLLLPGPYRPRRPPDPDPAGTCEGGSIPRAGTLRLGSGLAPGENSDLRLGRSRVRPPESSQRTERMVPFRDLGWRTRRHSRGRLYEGLNRSVASSLVARSIAWISQRPPEPRTRVRIPAGPLRIPWGGTRVRVVFESIHARR